MIKRLQQLPQYFLTLIVLFLAAVVFCCYFSKRDGFLLLNQLHPRWLDVFFSYLTNFGDGLLSIIGVGILLTAGKRKKAITLMLAFLYSGIWAQIAKKVFHTPRPKYFFEQINFQYTHFVEGLSMHDTNSFPSGHTASAFAMATVFVLVFKKKKISLPCVFIAVLIGYSRIYLAQHFPIDVMIGALIGVLCAVMSYYQVYDLRLFRSVKVSKRLKQFRITNSKITAG